MANLYDTSALKSFNEKEQSTYTGPKLSSGASAQAAYGMTQEQLDRYILEQDIINAAKQAAAANRR